MPFSMHRVTALVVASCFVAGLNVYATLATLGVLGRLHAIELPPGREVVTHGWVIGVSVALYVIEFIAEGPRVGGHVCDHERVTYPRPEWRTSLRSGDRP